jgi:hypothetical protein
MLRCVALVRTDILVELSASIIRVTRIDELGITLDVTSVRRLLVTANVVPSSPILVALIMEALSYSKMSVRTRATRRNIPEGAILQIPGNHSSEYNSASIDAHTGDYEALYVLICNGLQCAMFHGTELFNCNFVTLEITST